MLDPVPWKASYASECLKISQAMHGHTAVWRHFKHDSVHVSSAVLELMKGSNVVDSQHVKTRLIYLKISALIIHLHKGQGSLSCSLQERWKEVYWMELVEDSQNCMVRYLVGSIINKLSRVLAAFVNEFGDIGGFTTFFLFIYAIII